MNKNLNLKEVEKTHHENEKMDRQCDIYGVCSNEKRTPPSHRVSEFGLDCLKNKQIREV